MVVVSYTYEFNYRTSESGVAFPGLTIVVCNSTDDTKALEIEVHVDSGASLSLFDGDIASAIGLDLLAGAPQDYAGTRGAPIAARMHTVTLLHQELGDFTFPVGFSTDPIRRNLLGRDFLARIQVGFREYRQMFYVEVAP